MGELPVETAVFSPSDSGSVVQLEGTVGRQLRKSSLTSGGMLAPEIVVSGVEEWSLLDMEVVSWRALLCPLLLLCVILLWGFSF